MSDPNSQFGHAFANPQMQARNGQYYVSQMPQNQAFPMNMMPNVAGVQPYQFYYNQFRHPGVYPQQQFVMPHQVPPNYVIPPYQQPPNPVPYQYPQQVSHPYYPQNPQQPVNHSVTTSESKRERKLLEIIDPSTNKAVDLQAVAVGQVEFPSNLGDDSMLQTSKANTDVASPAPHVSPQELQQDMPTEDASERSTEINGVDESAGHACDVQMNSKSDTADPCNFSEQTSPEQMQAETYRYSQQELWELRRSPACLKVPDNFPDIPNVTILHDLDINEFDEIEAQLNRLVKNVCVHPASYDSRRGGFRGNMQGKYRHPQPGGMVINLNRDIAFKEAASVYKPQFKAGAVESDSEQLKRKIQSLLNKLTPENFDHIRDKIMELNIRTVDDIVALCELIFKKATNEKSYAPIFAKLCAEFKDKLFVPDDNDPGKFVYFQGPLIKLCQRTFEFKLEEYLAHEEKEFEAMVEAEPDERTRGIMLGNKQDVLKKRELQYYGNMRFIGELINLLVLKPSVFFFCTSQLTNENNSALDCLCELYNTTGEIVDKYQPEKMDKVFHFIEEQSKNLKLESRIRFKLLDLLEMRQRGWKKRDIQAQLNSGPMTLAEMQEKTRREEDDKAKAVRNVQRTSKSFMPQTPRQAETRNVKIDKLVLTNQSIVNTNNVVLGPSQVMKWSSGSMGGGKPKSGEKKLDISGDSWTTVDDRKGRQPSMRMDKRNRPASPLALATQNRFVDAATPTKPRSSQSSGKNTPPMQLQESSQSPQDTSRAAERNSSPVPAVASGSPAASNKVESETMSEEAIMRKAAWVIPEYMSTGDLDKEYYAVPAHLHANYVHQLLMFALEKCQATKEKTGEIIGKLLEMGVFTETSVLEGITSMIKYCEEEELEMDIPEFWKYMGDIFEGIICSESSRISFLGKVHGNPKKLSKMWSTLLHSASKRLGHRVVGQVFRQSNLAWGTLLPGINVETFVESEKLGFTVATTQAEKPAESLERSLALMENKDSDEIFDVIDAFLDSGSHLSSEALTSVVDFVLSSYLKNDMELFRSRLTILKKYASTGDATMSQQTEEIIIKALNRYRAQSDSRIWTEVAMELCSNHFISDSSLQQFVTERTA